MDTKPTYLGWGKSLVSGWGRAMSGPTQVWLSIAVVGILFLAGGISLAADSIPGIVITGFVAVGALHLTCYSLWAKERNKVIELQWWLTPKINFIDFDPDNEDHMKVKLEKGVSCLFVQVRPRCSVRLVDCVGEIERIMRIENHKWVKTKFTSAGRINWDIRGPHPTWMDPGVEPFLQILRVRDTNEAELIPYTNPADSEGLFKEGEIYRIDFSIHYLGGAASRSSMLFGLGTDWKHPHVKMLS